MYSKSVAVAVACIYVVFSVMFYQQKTLCIKTKRLFGCLLFLLIV